MNTELKKEIGWEIANKNVFIGDETGDARAESYKAITRDDTGGILSIKKRTYSPMCNSEFIDAVARISEISGFPLLGYNEFKGGVKILGFLENNRENFFIGSHKIKAYMLIGNSFDGTSSFFQGTSSILIRCQNQFSQISTQHNVRHSGDIQKKLEEFYTYLDLYFNQTSKLFKTLERFGDVKLTEELQEKMILFALGIDENSEKEISSMKLKQMDLLRDLILDEVTELGDNMWASFNGVTRLTTHELTTKHPTFGNVYGRPAEINTAAFNFANAQLTLN